MPDVFSKAKRSQVMSRIRSKNTKPEIVLRKALHAKGFRYVLHDKRLPGKPDLVFPKYHAIVHMRGCFWHGHTCIDGHIPKSRRDYWEPKLARNKKRDVSNDRKLRRQGWRILVVWECQCASIKKLEKTVDRVVRFLTGKC